MGDRITSSVRTRANTQSDDQASAEARRKLEAMFSGGGGSVGDLPVNRLGSQRVFASPRKSIGRTPTEYRMRLERLRIAREPDEIREATDLFLQHHQLPDDPDVLLKVLTHPDEKVLRDALGQISSLLFQGRLANTVLLADRLQELGGRVEEAATRSLLEGVSQQLVAARSKIVHAVKTGWSGRYMVASVWSTSDNVASR